MLTEQQKKKAWEKLEEIVQDIHMTTVDMKKAVKAGDSPTSMAVHIEDVQRDIAYYGQLLSLLAYNELVEEGRDPLA